MRPRASVHLKLHRTSRFKRPLCPRCCRPRSALSEGMVLPRGSKGTTGRMDKFTRGVVWGMSLAGLKPKDIVGKVHKKDGVRPKVRAVQKFIAKKKRFPEWQGDDSRAGGRPQELSAGEQKSLVDLVFEERGKAVVTVKYCRKRLPFLRRVHRSTVARALHRAGLEWLRRRGKTSVPPSSRQPRLDYCDWLLKQSTRKLRRFAYTDGTTFYLALSAAQQHDKKRACLGKFVWRMATREDGLCDDNVGPSLYAKSQGLPVKVWGFFANGRLEYYVLPKDGPKKTKHMNGTRYYDLIASRFVRWRRNCFGDDGPVYLVQDHEPCLWMDKCLQALKKAGCSLVDHHPKHSADLNAIEGWWHRLRQRIDATAPEEFEDRDMFLRRLNRTVTWMNENLQDEALEACTNQKVRAEAVKKLLGAKCKY